jgi:hypothetical protein
MGADDSRKRWRAAVMRVSRLGLKLAISLSDLGSVKIIDDPQSDSEK